MNNKKLLNLGIIYSASAILVQALNMLLVPIYTTNLSQEQFGELNLVNSVQAMVAIFISLGIYSGLARFFKEYSDGNRLKNIALIFSVFWCTALIAILYIFSPYLANIILTNSQFGSEYFQLIGFISATYTILTIYTVYYSMQYKVGMFSFISLGRALLMVVLSYYFLSSTTSELKIIEALKAQLYANGITLGVIILLDIKNIRFVWDKDEFINMIKYGIGLMPGDVSGWVYTLIDRYFINNVMGLKAVALYSMGYRIGMLMEPLFISPFKSVFTAYKYSVYKQENGKELILNFYERYNFLGWYLLLIISVGSKIAISILSTSEYIEAYTIVPLILLSYYFLGLGEFYALGIHLSNKSWIASTIYSISAVSNIVLNIVLIKPFGLYGAAIATLISSWLVNLVQFIVGRKYYDLGLSFFTPFKYIYLVVSMYVLYLFISAWGNNWTTEILLIILMVISFPIMAALLRLVSTAYLVNGINSFKSKVKNYYN